MFKNVINYDDVNRHDYEGIKKQFSQSVNGKVRIDSLFAWINNYSSKYASEFIKKYMELMEYSSRLPEHLLVAKNKRDAVKAQKDPLYPLLVKRNKILEEVNAFDISMNAAYREEISKYTTEAVISTDRDFFLDHLRNAKDIFFLPNRELPDAETVADVELDNWIVRKGIPFQGYGKSPLTYKDLDEQSMKSFTKNEKIASRDTIDVIQQTNVDRTIYCNDRVLLYHEHSMKYLTTTFKECHHGKENCAIFKPSANTHQMWIVTDCQEGSPVKLNGPISLRSESGSYLTFEEGQFSFNLQSSSNTKWNVVGRQNPNSVGNIRDGESVLLKFQPKGDDGFVNVESPPITKEQLFYVGTERGSYDDYRKACISRNGRLPTYSDFCNGPNDMRFTRKELDDIANTSYFKKSPDTWIAISDEDWLQIADGRICHSHNKRYGKPFWGDRIAFQYNFDHDIAFSAFCVKQVPINNEKVSLKQYKKGSHDQVLKLIKVGSLVPDYVESVTDITLRCGDRVVIQDTLGRYATIHNCSKEDTRKCVFFLEAQLRNQKFVIMGCTGTERITQETPVAFLAENGKYVNKVGMKLLAESTEVNDDSLFYLPVKKQNSLLTSISSKSNNKVQWMTRKDSMIAFVQDHHTHGGDFLIIKEDFTHNPNDPLIRCHDIVMYNIPRTNLYLTEARDGLKKYNSFEPLSKTGQQWIVQCDRNTPFLSGNSLAMVGESYTGSDWYGNHFKPHFSMSENNQLILSGNPPNNHEIKDRNIVRIFNQKSQTSYSYLTRNGKIEPQMVIPTSYPTPSNTDLTIMKIGGMIGLYNRRTEERIYCGDRIMIRVKNMYLTAYKNGAMNFRPSSDSGQTFTITNCEAGFPLTRETSVLLKTEFGQHIGINNGGSHVIAQQTGGTLLRFGMKTKVLEDDSLASIIETKSQKYLSSTTELTMKEQKLEIIKVRKVSAVVFEHKQNVDSDIIVCNDRITVRDQLRRFLTVKNGVISLEDDKVHSLQTWKVSSNECKGPIKPGEAITLTNDSGFKLQIPSKEGGVPDNSFIVKPFGIMAHSQDSSSHVIRDGDAIILEGVKTSYLMQCDNTTVVMESTLTPERENVFQINKVGTPWCGTYVENYVRRKNMKRQIWVAVESDDSAWLIIGEGNTQTVLPKIRCCESEYINISPYITNTNQRVRIRAYNAQKCSGGHLRLSVESNFNDDEFDCYTYLVRYEDVRKSLGSDCEKAKDHFLKLGKKEGRSAIYDRILHNKISMFNCAYYHFNNPDVEVHHPTCGDAFSHWLKHGIAEGRVANRIASKAWSPNSQK